jgi:hypothetical protein
MCQSLRKLAFTFLASFAATIMATEASAFTPVGVVTTSRVELEPAAAEGYLAYSRAVVGHPDLFDLLVKPDGASVFRANPRGTAAFAGNFDGTTLVYSQSPYLGHRADIKLLDVASRARSSPAGVNTRFHEAGPSLSGDWISFTRARRTSLAYPRRLLLRNLSTSEQRQLDFGDNAYVQNGGIAGDYAAWTRCPRPTRCSTWRYQISTKTKTRLPNPQDKSQFAVSVTPDGTVYYAESATLNCGPEKIVRFFRQPLAASREGLAALPRRRDTAVTSPLVHGDGSVDLYFDRFNGTCTKSDIFKIPIPAPGL